MTKSIETAKLNGSAPIAASVKRIALRSASAPTTRGATPSLKKKVVSSDNSPLEWYRLTEITMHVLNAVIIKNDKEQIAERSKVHPDQDKIRELELKIRKVIEIIRDAKNFDSTNRMRQLLEEYSNG